MRIILVLISIIILQVGSKNLPFERNQGPDDDSEFVDINTLKDRYLEVLQGFGGEGLGAGCSGLPAKCSPTNIASCTLNNCGDPCKVNCCNGNSAKKCQMPTCKGCPNTQCKNDTSQKCSGIEDSEAIEMEKY